MAGMRLLRFLLSIFAGFRLSARHIALAFRTRLASLWRSFLARGCRHGRGEIRAYASDVPRTAEADYRPKENEDGGTLAVRPFQPHVSWQEKVTRYQALASSYKREFVQKPATPAGGSRRYKARRVDPNAESLKISPGLHQLLSALSDPPEGWKRQVHPEGNVLYYHEDLRILTESDIFSRKNEIIYCATTLIQQAILEGDDLLDELTEIVLNVDEEGSWHYYFVNHKARLLFWVHEVRPREDFKMHLRGITEYSHITYFVEQHYWWHCEYYPHDRILPKGVYDSLRGMLNCAKIDIITSESSSCPFPRDDLSAILDLVNSLKDIETISDQYVIWVIARLMALITENQFFSFTGQSCARLDADTSLFGQQTWNRSLVFKFINILLLGSPNDHAVRLKRVWVDGIIIEPRWKDFVTRLTAELARYTIFSTVLLAVDISFLAVPGVITVGAPASPIQIIIYCSVVSTVASIIFSFLLLNMYSDPGLMTADSAARVMQALSYPHSGMARLAVTHSLPISCLVWSIALFSAALAVQLFGRGEYATVTTLGVECLVLVMCAGVGRSVMRQFYMNVDVEDTDTEPRKEEGTGTESSKSEV